LTIADFFHSQFTAQKYIIEKGKEAQLNSTAEYFNRNPMWAQDRVCIASPKYMACFCTSSHGENKETIFDQSEVHRSRCIQDLIQQVCNFKSSTAESAASEPKSDLSTDIQNCPIIGMIIAANCTISNFIR
jgi:hypothetical protein